MHVAILRPPYLRKILAGTKTIESRLTRHPIPPWQGITAGDMIYFKESSGPYRAVARAGEVRFIELHSPAQVQALAEQFNAQIGGAPEYWHLKRLSRYATLVTLDHVQPTHEGPRLAPSQGIAWFTLADHEANVLPEGARFEITLGQAALRNSYVIVPRRMHTFPSACYGGKNRCNAGVPVTLQFPGGRQVQTDLLGNGRFRWRGWRELLEAQQAAVPGVLIRFRELAPDRFSVRFVRATGTPAHQAQPENRNSGSRA